MDATTTFRRALHTHPELTWQEEETAAAVRAGLESAGLAWRACAGTGTLATLAPGAAGRHIALRADLDALPITEASGRQWSSANPGCMHACGHDGHTATLMAAAFWLKQHEEQLPGPVTLLFQPAEEGGHGAKKMIEDGALKGIDAIYGWHNWPAIPFGQALCPDGAVMAGNGTFEIFLKGQGGHASQPEACRDPVLAASAITLALQQIVARRLAPQHAAVVSLTSIEAPSGPTVIPDTAKMGGSIRLAQSEDREIINALIEEVAVNTAAAYGVTAEVRLQPRYDATVNHASEAALMREALSAELGVDWHATNTPAPIMASEDFSYYLKEIPGAFALIGADDGKGHDIPCHSPRYDFNDSLIPIVTRLYARLAGAPLP
jgi:hippurate hydrolase